MSRARWLALGSTVVLVGCNGAVQSSGGSDSPGTMQQDGSTADEGVTAEASAVDEGSSADAAALADTWTLPTEASDEASSDGAANDGGATCARSGSFVCGGQTCDRSSQLCDIMGGGCLAYDAMVPQQYPEAGSCGECPTCACLQPTLYGNCQCLEDDGGGVAISCGGCYGAPPARLERIV